MKTKLAIAAFSFAALATPALAADFFIVQDPGTKHCTIVDQKPTTTTTVVGNGTYTSRTEAETAMKSVQVCSSDGAATTGSSVTSGSSTTTTTTTK